MAEKFAGKYELQSSDNVERFLEKVGISLENQKSIALAPRAALSISGNIFYII